MEEGILKSNHHGVFKIIKNVGKRSVVIKFLDTGYETRVRKCFALEGTVRDPTARRVYGVGYVGVGKYDPKTHKKEYSRWLSKLRQCYSSHYHKRFPKCKGDRVDERWLDFQNFCEDIKEIPGYDMFASGMKVRLYEVVNEQGQKVFNINNCQFLRLKPARARG